MECIICCECTKLLSLSCKCNICSGCLIQSIDTKYIEVVDQIKCPGICNSKHTMDSLVSDPLLSGLHDILLHKYMRTNENLRICPKSDCNYGGLLIEKCYEYQCECGYLWKEKKNNLSWKSFITAIFTTRDCPKCNRGIYKNGGCNHMTCKCHYEFCWICTQQFQSHQQHICLQNVAIKYFLLFFMLLTMIHELGQISIFIATLNIIVKLIVFNGSLMFFYLGMNELYQMSKLRLECRKYYQYGNESYKRMGQQKLLMFIVMMVQFAIMCFFFNLFYVGEFITQYVTLLINETGFAVIIGTSVKLNSMRK